MMLHRLKGSGQLGPHHCCLHHQLQGRLEVLLGPPQVMGDEASEPVEWICSSSCRVASILQSCRFPQVLACKLLR